MYTCRNGSKGCAEDLIVAGADTDALSAEVTHDELVDSIAEKVRVTQNSFQPYTYVHMLTHTVHILSKHTHRDCAVEAIPCLFAYAKKSLYAATCTHNDSRLSEWILLVVHVCKNRSVSK